MKNMKIKSYTFKKNSVLNVEIDNKVSLLSLIINENNYSVHEIFFSLHMMY